jgi:hypothetical protein
MKSKVIIYWEIICKPKDYIKAKESFISAIEKPINYLSI